MTDEVGHRHQRHPAPLGDLGELRAASHRSVLGEDLADHAGRGEPG
jgi:hypothetical protein